MVVPTFNLLIIGVIGVKSYTCNLTLKGLAEQHKDITP